MRLTPEDISYILKLYGDSRRVLHDYLARLPQGDYLDLVALVWLGRDEYESFEEALSAVSGIETVAPGYLIGNRSFEDHLRAGAHKAGLMLLV